MRNYLSEDGLYVKSNTKLNELLDERHRIALNSEDDLIRLKAIDSSLNMASGNEKVVATQNNQFNFSDFLNNIKEQMKDRKEYKTESRGWRGVLNCYFQK